MTDSTALTLYSHDNTNMATNPTRCTIHSRADVFTMLAVRLGGLSQDGKGENNNGQRDPDQYTP